MPRPYRRLAASSALAFLAGLFVGCFKDAGADDAGGCADGSMGCACYGNGSCDGELECRDDVCVPAGCSAGALDCVCLEGECVGDLVCLDGTCQPDDAETGEASASGTDETETGTSDETETGPDDTSTNDTGPESTGPDDTSTTEMSSSSTSDSTETGMPDCDALGDCRECVECVGHDQCAEAYQDCANDPKCISYVDCAIACGGDDGCWSGCKGIAPNSYQFGDAWIVCSCDHCTQSCGDITKPACG